MARKISSRLVLDLAKLANLPLSKKEGMTLEPQLRETLSYVKILSRITTEFVLPTNQVNGLTNVTAEDQVRPSLLLKDVFANALSKKHGRFFRVPGILHDGT